MKLFKITEKTMNGSHPMDIWKTFVWADDEEGLQRHISDSTIKANESLQQGGLPGICFCATVEPAEPRDLAVCTFTDGEMKRHYPLQILLDHRTLLTEKEE